MMQCLYFCACIYRDWRTGAVTDLITWGWSQPRSQQADCTHRHWQESECSGDTPRHSVAQQPRMPGPETHAGCFHVGRIAGSRLPNADPPAMHLCPPGKAFNLACSSTPQNTHPPRQCEAGPQTSSHISAVSLDSLPPFVSSLKTWLFLCNRPVTSLFPLPLSINLRLFF